MSTATTPDFTAPLLGGRYHFLLRRLHSLTGIIFGLYILVHLFINATIAQGGQVYQNQVNKIHELPFLPLIEWSFIYLPILFHAAYGIWITVTGIPNVQHYPYGRNWNYLMQRVSAVILVLFILFHVLSLKYGLLGQNLGFDAHRALPTVGTHLQTSGLITWIVYPLGILAACFHLANGFWTGAITWGLTISAAAQRRWAMVCFVIFVFSFLAGMTSLVAGARLPVGAVLPAHP